MANSDDPNSKDVISPTGRARSRPVLPSITPSTKSAVSPTEAAAMMFRTRRFHTTKIVIDHPNLTTLERVDRLVDQLCEDGWEPLGSMLVPLRIDGDLHLVMYFKHYCSKSTGECVLCNPNTVPA